MLSNKQKSFEGSIKNLKNEEESLKGILNTIENKEGIKDFTTAWNNFHLRFVVQLVLIPVILSLFNSEPPVQVAIVFLNFGFMFYSKSKFNIIEKYTRLHRGEAEIVKKMIAYTQALVTETKNLLALDNDLTEKANSYDEALKKDVDWLELKEEELNDKEKKLDEKRKVVLAQLHEVKSELLAEKARVDSVAAQSGAYTFLVAEVIRDLNSLQSYGENVPQEKIKLVKDKFDKGISNMNVLKELPDFFPEDLRKVIVDLSSTFAKR